MDEAVARKVVSDELEVWGELLSCQLCKEEIQIPMMLPCGHNYCSLCIRRALSYQENITKCPLCSEKVEEKDLKKNLIIEQMLAQLHKTKARLIARVQQADGSKTTADAIKFEVYNSGFEGVQEFAQPITGKLAYHLMSEKDVKDRCKTEGLPDKAPKERLIKMHKEFVLRYNVQIDARNPRKEADIKKMIVKELSDEFRAEKEVTPARNPFEKAAAGAAAPSRTSNAQEELFDDLIKQANLSMEKTRERRKKEINEQEQARSCGDGSFGVSAHNTSRSNCFAEGYQMPSNRALEWGARISNLNGIAVPAPWVAIYSSHLDQIWYWNTDTKVGTFVLPLSEDGSRTEDVLGYTSQSLSPALCSETSATAGHGINTGDSSPNGQSRTKDLAENEWVSTRRSDPENRNTPQNAAGRSTPPTQDRSEQQRLLDSSQISNSREGAAGIFTLTNDSCSNQDASESTPLGKRARGPHFDSDPQPRGRQKIGQQHIDDQEVVPDSDEELGSVSKPITIDGMA